MSERENVLGPALTPEEWAKAEESIRACMYSEPVSDCRANVASIQKSGHAMAAVALHGQPFGFTREDVVTFRKMLDECDWTDCGPPGMSYTSQARRDEKARLYSLAARIEALLPPENAP